MFFVQWTTATATAEGAVWRLARCAHCSASYVFRVEVRIQHDEVELYSRGSPHQQERAVQGARDRLIYQLEHKVEPVPCPTCHQYQPDMCKELRKRRYGWMYTAAMFVLTLGSVVTAGVVAIATDGMRPNDEDRIMFGAVVAVFVTFVGLLWLQRWLSARYDPNVRVPAEQRMAIAEERAMTKSEFHRRHPGAETFEAGDR